MDWSKASELVPFPAPAEASITTHVQLSGRFEVSPDKNAPLYSIEVGVASFPPQDSCVDPRDITSQMTRRTRRGGKTARPIYNGYAVGRETASQFLATYHVAVVMKHSPNNIPEEEVPQLGGRT